MKVHVELMQMETLESLAAEWRQQYHKDVNPTSRTNSNIAFDNSSNWNDNALYSAHYQYSLHYSIKNPELCQEGLVFIGDTDFPAVNELMQIEAGA